MELVKLAHENIDQEHICCAISNSGHIQKELAVGAAG